jgi:hypothetical protein
MRHVGVMMFGMRKLVAVVGATAVLLGAPGATAKDFQPGDLRVCGANACVAIKDREVLRTLSSFYYIGPQPAVTWAPKAGARAFELRFRNGYATGVVASSALDRFLSYGVNLGRFSKGAWYGVPASAAAELRRLTSALTPLRVTAALLRKSH